MPKQKTHKATSKVLKKKKKYYYIDNINLEEID